MGKLAAQFSLVLQHGKVNCSGPTLHNNSQHSLRRKIYHFNGETEKDNFT